MPFVFDGANITSGTTGPFSASASSATLTLPTAIQDGDLLFAFFSSSASPTTAWTTPSGWTLAGTQKNGTNSFGGRAALFYKVWRSGDSTSVTSSGPTGTIASHCLAVRSPTDGASLVHGNPPASGYGGTYDAETTVSGTSVTVPRMNVATSGQDLMLFFFANTSASGQAFTWTPTAQATNEFRYSPQLWTQVHPGTQSGCGMWFSGADPAGLEAGTTTWTGVNSKHYVIGVVVHDPNSYSIVKEVELDYVDNPLSIVGLEHIVTVSQSGGGAAIIVF